MALPCLAAAFGAPINTSDEEESGSDSEVERDMKNVFTGNTRTHSNIVAQPTSETHFLTETEELYRSTGEVKNRIIAKEKNEIIAKHGVYMVKRPKDYDYIYASIEHYTECIRDGSASVQLTNDELALINDSVTSGELGREIQHKNADGSHLRPPTDNRNRLASLNPAIRTVKDDFYDHMVRVINGELEATRSSARNTCFHFEDEEFIIGDEHMIIAIPSYIEESRMQWLGKRCVVTLKPINLVINRVLHLRGTLIPSFADGTEREVLQSKDNRIKIAISVGKVDREAIVEALEPYAGNTKTLRGLVSFRESGKIFVDARKSLNFLYRGGYYQEYLVHRGYRGREPKVTEIFNQVHPEIINALFGNAQSASGTIDNPVNDARLNNCLGPPGTGKTHTLAATVYTLLLLNRKVLVTACSNQAVNEAALAVIRYAKNAGNTRLIEGGRLIRVMGANTTARCHPMLEQYRPHHFVYAEPDLVGNQEVLYNADVVFVTASAYTSQRFTYFAPSVVVVDEAGFLPLMYSLPVFDRGCPQLLIFGDDSQLTCVTQTREAQVSLQSHLMEGRQYLQLEIQYRMHTYIGSLISHNFYRGTLMHGTPEVDRELHLSLNGWDPKMPVMFIHSISEESSAGNNLSYRNLDQCSLIIDVICPIANQNPDLTILLLVFYTGELRVFTQAMAIRNINNIIVSTVDSVQGGEADLIVLSLCRSNPFKDIGFLGIPNRVNVALSRAKKGMLIFGDAITFCRNAMWRNILNKLNADGRIFTRVESGVLYRIDIEHSMTHPFDCHLAIKNLPFQTWDNEVMLWMSSIIGAGKVVDVRHIFCKVYGKEGARSGRFVARMTSVRNAVLAQQALNGLIVAGNTIETLLNGGRFSMERFMTFPEVHKLKVIVRGFHREEPPDIRESRCRDLLGGLNIAQIEHIIVKHQGYEKPEMIVSFGQMGEVARALRADHTYYSSSLVGAKQKYFEVLPYPVNKPYP